MKKWIMTAVVVGIFSGIMVFPGKSDAEINLSVSIPLPGLGIVAPPAMMVIPGTYAYFAPDVSADLFFYRGYWYRPYQGEWYYSAEFNGPWGRLAIGNVPSPLVNLPPDYRRVPSGYERMRYGTVKRNWRRWEEERHWDSGRGWDGYASRRGGHGMGMGMGR